MMGRPIGIQLLAGLVGVGCLVGSGVVATQLSASSGRHRLVYTDTAEEGQPWQVGVGIAMGAFRGMFVNYLWIRANQLKEDGRFYEAIDLARTITKLQPRFPHVWVFHAWNLAYNISVQSFTNEERWRWVSAGIDLLRREAIRANPNDLLIHRELAWIFLHKIGGVMDDANMYYKRQLAAEWTMVLGQPPKPDARDRDLAAAIAKWQDWLRPVAEAPDTLEALYQAEPTTRDLVDRLRSDLGFLPDRRVVQNYTTLTAVLGSGERAVFEREFNDRQRGFVRLMEDPALARAWPALVAHLRKRLLIEQYNMDPWRMIRYTERFGPLDWRHFASHALYWSERGVEEAMTRWTDRNRADFDFVNAGRMVVQSLQELWRSGDLFFDFLSFIRSPDDQRVLYRASPSIHFMDKYGEYLNNHIARIYADQRIASIQRFEDPRRRAFTLYASGYENFRKDAIRFLYRRGERARAERMKNELAVWPYHNTNDPDRPFLFSLTIDEFVQKMLEDELARPSVAREEVVGALQGAFVNGLIGGDGDLFREQMQYAANVHAYFYSRQPARSQLDPESARQTPFPRSFPMTAGLEFAALLSVLDMDDAEAMYDNAPEDLRRWGYDFLVQRFSQAVAEVVRAEQELGRRPRPFSERFPEPPGMPEHRAMLQRLMAEERAQQLNVEKR